MAEKMKDTMVNKKMLMRAVKDAFIKLSPKTEVKNPVMFLVALVIGSIVTGIVYAIIRKPLAEQTEAEDDNMDVDIDINIG